MAYARAQREAHRSGGEGAGPHAGAMCCGGIAIDNTVDAFVGSIAALLRLGTCRAEQVETNAFIAAADIFVFSPFHSGVTKPLRPELIRPHMQLGATSWGAAAQAASKRAAAW